MTALKLLGLTAQKLHPPPVNFLICNLRAKYPTVVCNAVKFLFQFEFFVLNALIPERVPVIQVYILI